MIFCGYPAPIMKETPHMETSKDIQEYVQSLKASKRLGGQVVFHKVMPAETGDLGRTDRCLARKNQSRCSAMPTSNKLFDHQAQAVDLLRTGRTCGRGDANRQWQNPDLQSHGHGEIFCATGFESPLHVSLKGACPGSAPQSE